jgi:hypothetical protein
MNHSERSGKATPRGKQSNEFKPSAPVAMARGFVSCRHNYLYDLYRQDYQLQATALTMKPTDRKENILSQ